jgi:hypothetical protein
VYGLLTFLHKLAAPSKWELKRRPLSCASCDSLCLKPTELKTGTAKTGIYKAFRLISWNWPGWRGREGANISGKPMVVKPVGGFSSNSYFTAKGRRMFGLFFQVKIGENSTKKVPDFVSFLLKSRRFVIYDFHLFGEGNPY